MRNESGIFSTFLHQMLFSIKQCKNSLFLDLTQNHPWILSEVSSGKFEKIAYAFVNLTKKAANSTNNKSYVGREQYNRKAGCGTWDGQTKRTEIRDSHDNLIGERRMLVFEINEVSDQEDLSRVGHWRMHEYHLCGVNKDIPNLSNTVLCKIILNHSKKPAIKLIPTKTTRSIKASAPEKNKTNTKKLDVVCSWSSTNTAVVDTFEGISKSCEAFTTPCDDDDLEWINSIYDECPVLEKVENGPMTDDDDDLDWINNIFVSKEGEDGELYINMSEFEFPSYPEHEDEQPPVDVTNNLGKRKLQAETSYEQMHAIGIYSRLDRVFDAPPAVKDVLIGQFKLEYSYIGSKETDERANEVQRLGIMDLWTPDNHYRWSKSRYGDHVSAVVESVNQSRLLLCNVDVEELESLRTRKKELEDAIAELETNLKVLQSEQRQNEDEAAKLQREREDILSIVQQERKRRRELESRVNQRRSKVKSLETEENMDTIMANLISSASDLNVQRFQCAIEIKNLLVETLAYRRSYAEQNMAVTELESKIRELEVGVKEQEKIAVQASQQFEYCKNEAEKFRQQLQAAKKHAESVSMISPDLEKLFLEMPSTIEELEAAIHDTMTEANNILLLNQNVLEEYENRQRKIDSLEGKQDEVEVELRRCVDEINALKESWLPTIRNLVAQINDTFSRNFKDMAVAGEVSLDERDIDYENYGILIKVKFREAGQLQVLSAHHQSGGERSVSTILYLVSLQDLTNCPFRVVDEINQGMDPVNERKMFQQLVRAASQPNTPQCFLLTPKLLSDLEYSEACSVINVMNGPWIEQSSKAWSGGGTWTSIVHSLTESRC